MRKVLWYVDVPNYEQIDGGQPHEWIEVGAFKRRKDAVNFVVSNIGLPRKAAKYFITRVEA